MRGLLFRDVEVDGRIVDVRVVGPTITDVGPSLERGGAEVVDGGGGALLPGLHDHHLHLLAAAAARSSVPVGPQDVGERGGLSAALRAADASLPPGRWLRAVGYHESVAGELDRDVLDELVAHRPLRVQHRTGAVWVLNSAAIEALGLDADTGAPAERDARGRPTGRLHRADAWLRGRLPPDAAPDLSALGRDLARCGVTGVTDATPFPHVTDLDVLAAAVAGGSLPQRVVAMGGPELAGARFPPGIEPGPVKVLLDDIALPALDDLVAHIALAHRCGRPVAFHCVTRTSLVLALAAWEEAGAAPGDRVEHGSVVPPELDPTIARLGLTVVTQPGFVAERGDEYLRDVDPDDVPHLYRCATLLEHAIPVGGSTDAPYTGIDPWPAMRAAVERATASGAALGAAEAVTAQRALELFLGDPHRPGGPPRAVVPGAPADLCLLAVPRHVALDRLSATDVAATSRNATLL